MASTLPRQDAPPDGSSSSNLYTFSSRPRPVPPQRFKYRESGEQNDKPYYGNIMFDPRVIRGNTYAQNVIPIKAPPDPVEIQRQQEAKRRAIARKRALELRLRTPEPVEGRKHIELQTELYLEELSDQIFTTNAQCQTDAFLDKPATPLFIPAKSGKDVATQIEEGDLFDFDREVQPVLEQLVGIIMERSLVEVREEEELAYLLEQRRAFEERQNVENVEIQRLEEQERRRCQEKVRRIAEQQKAMAKEKEAMEKIAVQAYTQNYLADLLPTVYVSLRNQGYLYDPVEKEIETDVIPLLLGEVDSFMNKKAIVEQLVDMLIYDLAAQQTSQPKRQEPQ